MAHDFDEALFDEVHGVPHVLRFCTAHGVAGLQLFDLQPKKPEDTKQACPQGADHVVNPPAIAAARASGSSSRVEARAVTQQPACQSAGLDDVSDSALLRLARTVDGGMNHLGVDMQERQASLPGRSSLGQYARGLNVSAVVPQTVRAAFAFDSFNEVQSRSFDAVFNTHDNVVLAAPTSSGKTAVLELAILRNLLLHQESGESAGLRGKAVYLAPLRSIVSEVGADWTRRLGRVGLNVTVLLSDGRSTSRQSDMEALRQADVVCTTPEKFDAMTRVWESNAALMGQIDLLLIDEVHFVGEQRGSILEAIVARLMLAARRPQVVQASWPASRLRCVALSATLPNTKALARLVELVGPGKSSYLNSLIDKYSDGRPCLVFCPTRKGTVQAAKALAASFTTGTRSGRSQRLSAESQQVLRSIAAQVEDAALKECLLGGAGFHSAGLGASDRSLVEHAFRSGHLPALTTTSTLSQGVNLPAHLVIIKSTSQWRGSRAGGYQEYPTSSILQMMGRAGRPQFDTYGVAVILTVEQHREKYLRIGSGSLSASSSLTESLLEYLNSEIALGFVQSEASALQWIQFTFWWSTIAEDQGETQANHRAKAVISAALERLVAKHFVDRQGGAMSPRLPCTVASRHTLSISTVEHLMRAFVPHLVQAGSRVDAAPPLDEEAFLYIVCECQEFSKAIRMRQGDKKVLNLAMRSGKTRWRRPHNRVKDLCDKVFVLVQLLQSGHKLEQRDLALDAKLCMDVLHRVCKALMLMLASDLVQSSLVRQAHTLCRCAQMEQWPEDASPLKQCSGVTKRTLEKLREAGVHSFPQLLEHSASSLAAATGLTTQACAGILRPLGDLRPLSVTAVARKHDQGRGWDVVVQLHGKVPALCAAAESTAPAWQRGWHLWLCSATGRLVAHERIQRSFSAELTLTVSEEDVMDDLFVSLQHVWFLSMDEQTAVSMSATEAGPQSSSAKPASQGE
ncbi:hfm1, partial [Symbiodinium sp. KB8]